MSPPVQEQTPSRRESDPDAMDFRSLRRPITGDEVQVGVGKYSLSLRGGMVISMIGLLAILGGLYIVLTAQQQGFADIRRDHDTSSRSLEKTLRLQTCVLSLLPDEKLQWRTSRDTSAALIAYCPSLMLSP